MSMHHWQANSRLQLAAKNFGKSCLGASRGSPELATIVLLAPVWHADDVAAWTNAATSEAQVVMPRRNFVRGRFDWLSRCGSHCR